MDHRLPPGRLDIFLQLGAQRPVIKRARKPAVDLGGLKNKAASFTQRNDLVH